jgi:hypothetical protein
MIRTYILNRNTRVVHLMLDSKTDERCNVDAIKAKSIFTGEGGRSDVEHLIRAGNTRTCFRCWI